jgi:hypothetical protein
MTAGGKQHKNQGEEKEPAWENEHLTLKITEQDKKIKPKRSTDT